MSKKILTPLEYSRKKSKFFSVEEEQEKAKKIKIKAKKAWFEPDEPQVLPDTAQWRAYQDLVTYIAERSANSEQFNAAIAALETHFCTPFLSFLHTADLVAAKKLVHTL